MSRVIGHIKQQMETNETSVCRSLKKYCTEQYKLRSQHTTNFLVLVLHKVFELKLFVTDTEN